MIGPNLKEKTMKKWYMSFILVGSLLMMCACSQAQSYDYKSTKSDDGVWEVKSADLILNGDEDANFEVSIDYLGDTSIDKGSTLSYKFYAGDDLLNAEPQALNDRQIYSEISVGIKEAISSGYEKKLKETVNVEDEVVSHADALYVVIDYTVDGQSKTDTILCKNE